MCFLAQRVTREACECKTSAAVSEANGGHGVNPAIQGDD